MPAKADWRERLVGGLELRHAAEPAGNPLDWPGYQPRDAMGWAPGELGGTRCVFCVWDFAAHGGSFGQREADTFRDACRAAALQRRPLVTLVRSSGTRLQEGVAALVGIPRALLALTSLSAAGVPHICVADHPTTGGVWVAIGSTAELRVGVRGAVVGFSGPRVVEAMTGQRVPRGAHSAESALAAGLLDAAVPGDEVAGLLARALRSVWAASERADTAEPMEEQPAAGPPRPAGDRPTDAGWSQVLVARTADRPPGWQLIAALVDQPVELGGADRAVRAVLGRSAGSRTVAVALCAHRGSWPGPGGFAQLARAARLADAAAAQLVVLVDTPGANSSAGSEAAGIAPAIATAMRAVLECRSPTLCLVHGEGGSGGALAGAVTDRVLVTPHSYFSALGPEGAGVALHMSAAEAADAMGLGPAQLLRLGFAQAMAPTEPGPLRAAVADQLAQLAGEATEERLARRRARWGSRLPGRAGDGPARSGLPIG